MGDKTKEEILQDLKLVKADNEELEIANEELETENEKLVLVNKELRKELKKARSAPAPVGRRNVHGKELK